MKTIHKQHLEITGSQKIKLPIGSKILSVGNQNEKLCIWYACSTEGDIIEKNIVIFGTGHQIWPSFDGKFIGTVIMANGQLVWHVFEEI